MAMVNVHEVVDDPMVELEMSSKALAGSWRKRGVVQPHACSLPKGYGGGGGAACTSNICRGVRYQHATLAQPTKYNSPRHAIQTIVKHAQSIPETEGRRQETTARVYITPAPAYPSRGLERRGAKPLAATYKSASGSTAIATH